MGKKFYKKFWFQRMGNKEDIARIERIKDFMYIIVHNRVENDNIKQDIFRDIKEYFKDL